MAMVESESPISCLTEVEYFGLSGTYYETADALVHQLSAATKIPISMLLDAEDGDKIIGLLALAMGPIDHIDSMEVCIGKLTDGHLMANKLSPVIGLPGLLDEEHPLRIIFERLQRNLNTLGILERRKPKG